MKQIATYFLIILIFVSVGWMGNNAYQLITKETDPLGIKIQPTPVPTPLARYSIENLAQTEFKPSQITIGESLKEVKSEEDKFGFTSNKFFFDMEGKKVSGLMNTPTANSLRPIVMMYRGFVAQEIYRTGMGTKNTAEFFAQNGFITLAPDFLGYGDSERESSDIFETRFLTHVTAATLLKSINIKNLPNWDGRNIFLWGHSNGGQVALTTLEITGVTYPTVLWAPVSKPFPYSILYYTDEAADNGKFLRLELAKFEAIYDVEKYSLINYLDRIKAPIQLNQGTSDEAIPTIWSDKLAEKLLELKIDVTYLKYSGADHNMNPKWNDAVVNAVDFYTTKLK